MLQGVGGGLHRSWKSVRTAGNSHNVFVAAVRDGMGRKQ